jgi:hypothetical protein
MNRITQADIDSLMATVDIHSTERAKSVKRAETATMAEIRQLSDDSLPFGKYLEKGRGDTLVTTGFDHPTESMDEGPHSLIYEQGPPKVLAQKLAFLAQRHKAKYQGAA